MATLDSYLQAQLSHNATHFVLHAGHEIVFVIEGVERPMTAEKVDAATVVALLCEIAPPQAKESIQANGRFEFHYSTKNSPFLCTGHPTASGPRAVFTIGETFFVPEDPASIVDAVTEPSIHRLFRFMVEKKASDLHLSVGEPPMIRESGDMIRIPGEPTLTDESLRDLLFEIAPSKNREEFMECGDTDFAHEIPNLARFRANYFRDRNGAGAVFRQIPTKILTVEDLGLPEEVKQLCFLSKGLVLVTGPTGSGKSTTLAALIDLVNRARKDHIITIEDPIEFVHQNKGCLINQREVRIHTRSFSSALRAALREDPDIILVGEMRDQDTIAAALTAAETGHLVLSTLHSASAAMAIDRIIDVFPGHKQPQVRLQLAGALRAVVTQVLLPTTGLGRVPAFEKMIVTTAVASQIREGRAHQIANQIQTGRNEGMVSLEQSLVALLRSGRVSVEAALAVAPDPEGLRR
ncbi:MAG TPA: type IV pilus twitching motility protein PilT, partial [Fibrobacteria bacterium]|nr:type IV pilus twitching motility protein PilT [Fibrobacteria bacterium]